MLRCSSCFSLYPLEAHRDGSSTRYCTERVIDFYEIDHRLASEIFYRWESGDFKLLSEFSPYAFYCISVLAMYFVGINNNLFSERKTNLADLEYLVAEYLVRMTNF